MILVLTILTVVGKVVTCSFGTFLAGYPGRVALPVGLGKAQIGEFSFIIANLGRTSGVASETLYPIAVGVSLVTAFLTPYLLRSASVVTAALTRHRFAAIIILVVLSGLASAGTITATDVGWALLRVSMFMATALLLGLFFVPRLLTFVASFKRSEMLTVTVLGLAFGQAGKDHQNNDGGNVFDNKDTEDNLSKQFA